MPVKFCIFTAAIKVTWSQVIGFPSLSMAPSATMMMFNLWRQSYQTFLFVADEEARLELVPEVHFQPSMD